MRNSIAKHRKLAKPESSFWRHFVNLLTILLYVLIFLDFRSGNGLESLVAAGCIIYTGALTIYSAEKEFERWHDYHRARHPGEVYVMAWTVILIGLFAAESIFHYPYRIPPDVIAVYIVVLGLLAITKKSKQQYEHKLRHTKKDMH